MTIQVKESVLFTIIPYFFVEVVEVSAEGTMRKRFLNMSARPYGFATAKLANFLERYPLFEADINSCIKNPVTSISTGTYWYTLSKSRQNAEINHN